MSTRLQQAGRLTTIAVLLVSAACAKKEAPKPAEPPVVVAPAPPTPLAVGAIDLGRGIGADRAVTAADSSFGVRDTIYAAVHTTGVGTSASIGARWTFVKAAGGEVPVNESSQSITTTGPSITEFHISKASAWPKGRYKVEILLNGAAAGTREFTIR